MMLVIIIGRPVAYPIGYCCSIIGPTTVRPLTSLSAKERLRYIEN